jgi:hypothetical protein
MNPFWLTVEFPCAHRQFFSQLRLMIPSSSVLTALYFLPTQTRTFWTSLFQKSIYFLSFQLTISSHAIRVQWTVWGTQQYNQHNLSVSYIESPTSLTELISISITDRLHPLCCQYDFILYLSANNIHKTKININHTVCSEVLTYYKQKSTGLHKSPSFLSASYLRYNRRSKHRAAIFKDRNSCDMNLAVFSFPPFFKKKRTKDKVFILSRHCVGLHFNL